MARLHKIEIYVVDSNDTYDDSETVLAELESNLYDGWIECFNQSTVDIKEEDYEDINKTYATKDLHDKLDRHFR